MIISQLESILAFLKAQIDYKHEDILSIKEQEFLGDKGVNTRKAVAYLMVVFFELIKNSNDGILKAYFNEDLWVRNAISHNKSSYFISDKQSFLNLIGDFIENSERKIIDYKDNKISKNYMNNQNYKKLYCQSFEQVLLNINETIKSLSAICNLGNANKVKSGKNKKNNKKKNNSQVKIDYIMIMAVFFDAITLTENSYYSNANNYNRKDEFVKKFKINFNGEETIKIEFIKLIDFLEGIRHIIAHPEINSIVIVDNDIVLSKDFLSLSSKISRAINEFNKAVPDGLSKKINPIALDSTIEIKSLVIENDEKINEISPKKDNIVISFSGMEDDIKEKSFSKVLNNIKGFLTSKNVDNKVLSKLCDLVLNTTGYWIEDQENYFEGLLKIFLEYNPGDYYFWNNLIIFAKDFCFEKNEIDKNSAAIFAFALELNGDIVSWESIFLDILEKNTTLFNDFMEKAAEKGLIDINNKLPDFEKYKFMIFLTQSVKNNDIFSKMLKSGKLDPNMVFKQADIFELRLLHLIVAHGRIEFLKSLLLYSSTASEKVDINAPAYGGYGFKTYSLHLTCVDFQGNIRSAYNAMFKFVLKIGFALRDSNFLIILLKNGVDVNLQDSYGETILHHLMLYNDQKNSLFKIQIFKMKAAINLGKINPTVKNIINDSDLINFSIMNDYFNIFMMLFKNISSNFLSNFSLDVSCNDILDMCGKLTQSKFLSNNMENKISSLMKNLIESPVFGEIIKIKVGEKEYKNMLKREDNILYYICQFSLWDLKTYCEFNVEYGTKTISFKTLREFYTKYQKLEQFKTLNYLEDWMISKEIYPIELNFYYEVLGKKQENLSRKWEIRSLINQKSETISSVIIVPLNEKSESNEKVTEFVDSHKEWLKNELNNIYQRIKKYREYFLLSDFIIKLYSELKFQREPILIACTYQIFVIMEKILTEHKYEWNTNSSPSTLLKQRILELKLYCRIVFQLSDPEGYKQEQAAKRLEMQAKLTSKQKLEQKSNQTLLSDKLVNCMGTHFFKPVYCYAPESERGFPTKPPDDLKRSPANNVVGLHYV